MPLKTMRDEQPSINLAPMIDIVFLLIIFFMVGSQFTQWSGEERDLNVHVPQVAPTPANAADQRKRVINVLNTGEIRLDDQTVELGQLESLLRDARAQNPKTGVVIRGDSNSAYQAVADVIAACRRAEIQDLNLAVRVAQAER
jgi:biopolymer transport protein ExbD